MLVTVFYFPGTPKEKRLSCDFIIYLKTEYVQKCGFSTNSFLWFYL